MKVQIRRSILTYLYEVQTCENGRSVWNTIKEFKTRAEAEKYAATLNEKKPAKVRNTKKTKK